MIFVLLTLAERPAFSFLHRRQKENTDVAEISSHPLSLTDLLEDDAIKRKQ